MKPRRPLRVRLSLWKSGRESLELFTAPDRHHACKTAERASTLLANYRRHLGPKWARIVMHTGNLKHHSYTILEDCTPSSEARIKEITEAAQAAERIAIGATPELDSITARHTAFSTFTDLVTAPAYWPSLGVSNPDRATLADAYDLAQARRKDSRRVNRYSAAI